MTVPPVERAHIYASKGCPFCALQDLTYGSGYWECQNCGEMGFAEIVQGLPFAWGRLEAPVPWEPGS